MHELREITYVSVDTGFCQFSCFFHFFQVPCLISRFTHCHMVFLCIRHHCAGGTWIVARGEIFSCRHFSVYIDSRAPDTFQWTYGVCLHGSMDFVKFIKFLRNFLAFYSGNSSICGTREIHPFWDIVRWKFIHSETLLCGYSSTFETHPTRWLSIFGPISTLAKGSSSVNFPSGHFRVFVTLSDFCDHSITFPVCVILLDYISHLTLTGLELKSLSLPRYITS